MIYHAENKIYVTMPENPVTNKINNLKLFVVPRDSIALFIGPIRFTYHPLKQLSYDSSVLRSYNAMMPVVVSKQTNVISSKLQDNLHHKTYTHKSHNPCTLRLKYRIEISMRNYILQTIRQVHEILRSMPSTLDRYATPVVPS